MLGRLHHVAQINVIRMDIVPSESLDERTQDGGVVVDPAQQHRLIAHEYALLVQAPHGGLHHWSDLVGMIEVGMHADILEHRSAARDQLQDGVEPVLIAQHFHRLHRKHLGGETNPADMLDVQQRVSQRANVCGLEPGQIAAGHDDVLDLCV